MRYSIIHHDVREKFKLTVSDYMVIDSIHQLSHKYPTVYPNTVIAKFLGIDEKSVRRAKEIGKEKNLLVFLNGGWVTTTIWDEAVTFSSGRQIAELPRQNAEKAGQIAEHTTNKEYKEIYIVDENEKPPRKKTDVTYRGVFELWGTYPANWRMNKTHIASAKNLLEEHGLDEAGKALRFAQRHKDDPFVPEILSPYDLDSKWQKLTAFRDKRV